MMTFSFVAQLLLVLAFGSQTLLALGYPSLASDPESGAVHRMKWHTQYIPRFVDYDDQAIPVSSYIMAMNRPRRDLPSLARLPVMRPKKTTDAFRLKRGNDDLMDIEIVPEKKDMSSGVYRLKKGGNSFRL